MQTIMFASGSGGCGKTTLALSLARELSHAGHTALVAELCCGFGCAADILGLADGTAFSLSDLLAGRCAPEQAAVAHRSGMLLLSAPADCAYIPAPEALAGLLRQAEELGCEFLFFDCAAGFSPAQKNAVPLCDTAILVSTPDYVSARGAGTLRAAIAACGGAVPRLLLNRVGAAPDPAAGIADLDEAIDLAGARLLGVVPEQRGARRGFLGADAPQRAVHNVAGRLLGKSIQLLPQFL